MRFLTLLLLLALAGCADPGDAPPPSRTLAYTSVLTSEHDPAFRNAEVIWERMTGLNLFDPDGSPVTVGYANLEWPLRGWTDNGNIVFDPTPAFSTSCLGAVFSSLALHELGHALGLNDSAEPTSIMYLPIRGCRVPSKEDIETVRSLWQ